ncbi:MAG: hypothetical protein CMB94_02940 [Flammeovirgaceae bacterium]|nr:hypothetical protein [Flammeovirgaceae bacterium]
MKCLNIHTVLIFSLIIISCNQLEDSFNLPGEDKNDIVYYELKNDYLAPESREFIEGNFPSESINSSYILIGKDSYGFEADLSNEMSLSFDEDGVFRFNRDHPFIKDRFSKGIYGFNRGGGGKGGEDKGDKEKDEGDREKKDRDKGDKEKDEDKNYKSERCFEFIMPYSIIMPDSSIISIAEENDMEKIKTWYDDNPNTKKRHKIQFPVDIKFLVSKSGENKVETLSSPKDLKKVMEFCKGGMEKFKEDRKRKGKKDKCKKQDISEIEECIKDYISQNFSDDEIVHARTVVTKDDVTLHIVKLKENGILKFNEDCHFID